MRDNKMKNLLRKLKIKRRIIALLATLHFFGNPSAKLKIVGVTGTSGKTTTATLLYRIAIDLGYKAGLISTVENIINGKIVATSDNRPIPGTTPDPITLYKLLNKMMDEGCEYVFMEVSSHSLDQRRVAGINFTGGIFTNLTQDHFDYHKNFENYFEAKKKFFKMLPSRAFALTNADDKYGVKMLEGIKANQFSYGFTKDFDEVHFHGQIQKVDFNGLDLLFNKIEIKSKLVGRFNAYNLLAVWSACSLLGFDMDKVNKIIENIEPPRGRFEHFTSANGVLVIVDYAHKPDALDKVFVPIKDVIEKNKAMGKPGKIISVFGCGGDRDPSKRPIMGKIGAENSDIAIFTSDNSRSEDPNKIIEEMKTDLSPEMLEKVKSITDRREAIIEAVKLAKNGDVILCAGKGHEDYQEIKGEKHHFDDMEELKKAYERL
ncbi:MAG: UDP-N-acetylmuramoyl-L-alanyl-D-glutamate--2,6-diaminopimelate ligase [Candidatus Paceibacterota bacterium]|jgi:UDP-N-acetylmuramoyl-L-alanyl-D-glutamate--2,6-diaminopimelate ligase